MISGLELSCICFGEEMAVTGSCLSVHADMLWTWQHAWQHFGSWSTRLNNSSLPKLESTPCWSTNSAGYNRQLPFSDQILNIFGLIDAHHAVCLFGHAWHWAEHSCLSILQNWTEDGLNYISTLIKRLQIWCPLSGHCPNTPLDRNKHEVTVTALTLPYPVLVASRSKARLW